MFKLTFKQFFIIILFLNMDPFVNSQAVDPDKYIQAIGERIVKKLEERPISGNTLPMKNFENQINATRYGLNIDGKVNFHSGFVSRIEAAVLPIRTIQTIVLDKETTIKGTLILQGVQTVYDLNVDVIGFQANASFLLWFPDIEFPITIIKDHQTKLVTPTIQYGTIGNQNRLIAQFQPNNGYMQLIAREMKSTYDFRQPLVLSFVDWKITILQELLEIAVNEINFPEICYYCV